MESPNIIIRRQFFQAALGKKLKTPQKRVDLKLCLQKPKTHCIPWENNIHI